MILMTLMILMIVVVMTTKMQTCAEEMCIPPQVEYWRSAAGGVPLRPSRVIENNQRTNMFDRILTTRDTTANKGNLLQMINRFKIRKFIASWQSFYILSFWSRITRNGIDLMNKDYLGQQGKKVQEVGWQKKTENKVFSKKWHVVLSSCMKIVLF